MKNIVQELQAEALSQDISITDLLRKAKLVAVKLDLKNFLTWIENELNGYGTIKRKDLPSYRIIGAEPKAWNPYYGWQPIIYKDTESELLYRRGINQPIGTLEALLKTEASKGIFFMDPGAKLRQLIADSIDFQTDIKFLIGRSAIAGIIDSVRNIILDWSLKLEKEGITGEGLSFSKKEKEIAKDSQTIYKIGNIENFAGAIGDISGNAKIEVQQLNIDSKQKLEELKELVKQIKKYSPEIKFKESDKERLNKSLEELEIETESKKPQPSRISKALGSVKSIFEGATGNVIAQGIIVAIQKFVGPS